MEPTMSGSNDSLFLKHASQAACRKFKAANRRHFGARRLRESECRGYATVMDPDPELNDAARVGTSRLRKK